MSTDIPPLDRSTAQYSFKREYWKTNIDAEISEREEFVLSQQVAGRPVGNCSARTEAWRELLNDAAAKLHHADPRDSESWRALNERVTLLLAWRELA